MKKYNLDKELNSFYTDNFEEFDQRSEEVNKYQKHYNRIILFSILWYSSILLLLPQYNKFIPMGISAPLFLIIYSFGLFITIYSIRKIKLKINKISLTDKENTIHKLCRIANKLQNYLRSRKLDEIEETVQIIDSFLESNYYTTYQSSGFFIENEIYEFFRSLGYV